MIDRIFSLLVIACGLALADFATAAPRPQTGDAVQQEDSWPTWRGSDRDGHSPSTGINTDWETNPPKLLWQAGGLGEGYGSVSIAQGMIFSTGNKQNQQVLTASALSDGKVLWQTPITDSLPGHDYAGARCTPTFSDGKVYAVPSSGGIVCLDATSGKKLWEHNFSKWGGRMMSVWGFSESPLVDEGFVLFTPGGPNAAIVKLDKDTGKEIWRSSIPAGGDGTNKVGKRLQKGAAYSSIVVGQISGVKQYVQLVAEGVVGIRANDGKLMWGYEDVSNDVAAIPTPLIGEDFVFASSGYGTGSCLLKISKNQNETKASVAYFLEANQFENHHGGMVAQDGYVYAGHGHGKGFPICIRISDGQVMWKERGPGTGSAAVVWVDNHLIFRYQNGTVALIQANPNSYRLKGQFRPVLQERESWAHPVVVNRRLYLREQDGIMCYDLAPASQE